MPPNHKIDKNEHFVGSTTPFVGFHVVKMFPEKSKGIKKPPGMGGLVYKVK